MDNNEEKILEQTSEQGHWYEADGTPKYTIIGKNGKRRNTTLRDARKLNLKPSVTSIIALAAKPMLQSWIIDQHILSCLTLERQEGEADEFFLARIKQDANEQSKQAALRGKQIHAWIEDGLKGKELPEEGQGFYLAALKELETKIGKREWQCEQSFATETYGGKIDLESETEIIDIKTTEKDLLTEVKTWHDQHMQLGAYDRGRNKKCGILYVNKHNANSVLVWLTDEERKKGYGCFLALVNYWKVKNGM